MECRAVWMRDVKYKKRKYKKTGGLKVWRRMEKINWTEHITNEEVLAGK